MITIAIIGTGNRGKYAFGKMISKRTDATIIAMADPNRTRMKLVAENLGGKINLYASANELFSHETPDAVIITSPDYTHEEIAISAIDHHIPILVDKPLATTTAGCMRIIKKAKKEKGSVAVGFNLRHYPIVKKAKDLVNEGIIGDLMMIENREFYDGGKTYMARWNRKYQWSGGLWVHKGSHDFDIFNWFNEKGNPVRVSSFAGINAFTREKIPFPLKDGIDVGPWCSVCAYKEECPDIYNISKLQEFSHTDAIDEDQYHKDTCLYTSEKDVHDNGIAIVEYDNNVRASHIECFVSNHTNRIYTIIGEKGSLEFQLATPDRILFRKRWSNKDTVFHVPPASAGGHGGSDPDLLETFLQSISSKTESSSTMRDGIRAVAIGEAAELSWRTHRMVEISDLVNLQDPDIA
ncbi:MAG: Gfo/Idh/MocA family oxidoreductase [Candidatus Ratteibacteria bacterium]|jgi:predicted dehydrogenase